MSKKAYANQPELLNAVNECMIRRLTYKEAVEELTRRDFPMNEKRYQRIKSYIEKSIRERFNYMATDGQSKLYLEMIDIVNMAKDKCIKILHDGTPDQQLRAVDRLFKYAEVSGALQEARPVMVELMKRMNGPQNGTESGTTQLGQ